MSISATDRLRSTHRLSFPDIAVAVLAALALFAVLVAMAPGRAVSGYFRDPTTRVRLPVSTPAASEAAPRPGVK